MEVFLLADNAFGFCVRLLHVRGGVSYWANGLIFAVRSSPRPWRCFEVPRASPAHASVFSTSVEVFPKYRSASLQRWGLLHVRGGVSKEGSTLQYSTRSSPRPWRCFSRQTRRVPKRSVFSTSVEVFLLRGGFQIKTKSLLHVRGGVSFSGVGWVSVRASSPRPWRCFSPRRSLSARAPVFSTSVEVFPCTPSAMVMVSSLLHVRGGVST